MVESCLGSNLMRRHKWEAPECHSGLRTRSDYINGADAIPLASVIEFTLATNVGQDFYDVRLVDGFNLPLSITPQGRPASCSATSCAANVNAASHPELQVKGSDGRVIACKRACLAFNQPRYCCTSTYNIPSTCHLTQYSKIFKSQCP
ncbi:hypothetical protein Gogos_009384 [Gossypium gossypioides]|uniref:Thaumatin-like protein n=1 Tax=Gossypium gossypioides TaxID=34282 RepID=A0A7J9CEP0_GOSGO|nr:hypothetical protein [Gossypium gossypioides]